MPYTEGLIFIDGGSFGAIILIPFLDFLLPRAEREPFKIGRPLVITRETASPIPEAS